MPRNLTPPTLVYRLLGKAGLPSRSEAHRSRLERTPNMAAVPVWVFGFPRTGTTTAQALIANALSYNASFEPFSRTHATELGFPGAHELFLGNPARARWSDYVTSTGVNAALSTMDGTAEGDEKREMFESYMDALYDKFGRNTVFKEIRLFANLDAVDRYHKTRGVPWVSICLHAHPLRPLYTFYRIGALCSRAPGFTSYPEFVYQYRIATYERLGLYADLRNLRVSSIAEKLVVACLLDQAHMRSFANSSSTHRMLACLTDVAERLPELRDWTGTAPVRGTSIPIKTSQRYAEDPLFRKAILEKLSPQLLDAMQRAGHPVPSALGEIPSTRQFATFLRFRLYE